ncbi:hypothetical protein LY78DRAFT_654442 [Colletotrichum sublineola]|nr:hypothetical protein LY78DRAFT_654442 [Colletotrichum sublineola]
MARRWDRGNARGDGKGVGAWATRAPDLHSRSCTRRPGPLFSSLPPAPSLRPVLIRFLFIVRHVRPGIHVDRGAAQLGFPPSFCCMEPCRRQRCINKDVQKLVSKPIHEVQENAEIWGGPGGLSSSPAWPPIWPSTRFRMPDAACPRRTTTNGRPPPPPEDTPHAGLPKHACRFHHGCESRLRNH